MIILETVTMSQSQPVPKGKEKKLSMDSNESGGNVSTQSLQLLVPNADTSR